MHIIVGLGNPGIEYEWTRHNIGFHVIDELAKRFQIDVRKLKWKSLYGQGTIGDEKVLLVKPQTYMNNSGIAVSEIMNFYKVPISNLIVVCDDIDIRPGSVRIKRSGSAGTHNGLKSVIYHLMNDGFPRIKVSVGKKPEYMDLADFVLSKFLKAEEKTVQEEIQIAANAVASIIDNGIDATMNLYNVRR